MNWWPAPGLTIQGHDTRFGKGGYESSLFAAFAAAVLLRNEQEFATCDAEGEKRPFAAVNVDGRHGPKRLQPGKEPTQPHWPGRVTHGALA